MIEFPLLRGDSNDSIFQKEIEHKISIVLKIIKKSCRYRRYRPEYTIVNARLVQRDWTTIRDKEPGLEVDDCS